MKQPSKKRGRPVKAKALAKSPHLHLTHRRHSFKLLPHHATSYPMLAMIILCVGVLMVSWTHLVGAADYAVHASVPGLPPTVAATISSPTDGDSFTSTPVNVTGTCPLDTYVSLYRNDVFSGVALCDADGNYTISTDLFPGANQLQVKVFSRTDLPGPVEPPINVTYTPPIVPPTNTGSTGGSPAGGTTSSSKPNAADNVPATQALVLAGSYTYRGSYVGSPVSYQVALSGGLAPYAIDVDWGDGQHSLLSRATTGSFDLTHIYKTANPAHSSYPIQVTASDAAGQQTNLQLVTVVSPVGGAATGQSGSQAGTGSLSVQGALRYLWPAYGVTVLMLASFWLGERHEFGLLRRNRRLKHS